MKIEQAREEDFLSIKNLWKTSFGEADEFLDFYFNERYKQEGTLVARAGEKVSASLQAVSMMLQHQGRKLAAAYILGVATHPDHRRQGYAGSLMKASLLEQSQKGVLVSALIPAQPYLFDVYRKYGFTEIFSIKEQEIHLQDMKAENSEREYRICRYKQGKLLFDLKEMERFFEFYIWAYQQTDYSLLKSKEDFLFCIREFLLFEGDIYTVIQKERVVACAFLANPEGTGFIKELLFCDEGCKNFLLGEILNKTKQDSIIVKTPPEKDCGAGLKPLGMARIINVYGTLQALAKGNDVLLGIKVTDSVIQENNNVFWLRGNKVEIGKEGDSVNLNLTVGDFTLLALGYGLDVDAYLEGRLPLSGYMNLMLND